MSCKQTLDQPSKEDTGLQLNDFPFAVGFTRTFIDECNEAMRNGTYPCGLADTFPNGISIKDRVTSFFCKLFGSTASITLKTIRINAGDARFPFPGTALSNALFTLPSGKQLKCTHFWNTEVNLNLPKSPPKNELIFASPLFRKKADAEEFSLRFLYKTLCEGRRENLTERPSADTSRSADCIFQQDYNQPLPTWLCPFSPAAEDATSATPLAALAGDRNDIPAAATTEEAAPLNGQERLTAVNKCLLSFLRNNPDKTIIQYSAAAVMRAASKRGSMQLEGRDYLVVLKTLRQNNSARLNGMTPGAAASAAATTAAAAASAPPPSSPQQGRDDCFPHDDGTANDGAAFSSTSSATTNQGPYVKLQVFVAQMLKRDWNAVSDALYFHRAKVNVKTDLVIDPSQLPFPVSEQQDHAWLGTAYALFCIDKHVYDNAAADLEWEFGRPTVINPLSTRNTAVDGECADRELLNNEKDNSAGRSEASSVPLQATQSKPVVYVELPLVTVPLCSKGGISDLVCFARVAEMFFPEAFARHCQTLDPYGQTSADLYESQGKPLSDRVAKLKAMQDGDICKTADSGKTDDAGCQKKANDAQGGSKNDADDANACARDAAAQHHETLASAPSAMSTLGTAREAAPATVDLCVPAKPATSEQAKATTPPPQKQRQQQRDREVAAATPSAPVQEEKGGRERLCCSDDGNNLLLTATRRACELLRDRYYAIPSQMGRLAIANSNRSTIDVAQRRKIAKLLHEQQEGLMTLALQCLTTDILESEGNRRAFHAAAKMLAPFLMSHPPPFSTAEGERDTCAEGELKKMVCSVLERFPLQHEQDDTVPSKMAGQQHQQLPVVQLVRRLYWRADMEEVPVATGTAQHPTDSPKSSLSQAEEVAQSCGMQYVYVCTVFDEAGDVFASYRGDTAYDREGLFAGSQAMLTEVEEEDKEGEKPCLKNAGSSESDTDETAAAPTSLLTSYDPNPALLATAPAATGVADSPLLPLTAVCFAALRKAARKLGRESLFLSIFAQFSTLHASFQAQAPMSSYCDFLCAYFFGDADMIRLTSSAQQRRSTGALAAMSVGGSKQQQQGGGGEGGGAHVPLPTCGDSGGTAKTVASPVTYQLEKTSGAKWQMSVCLCRCTDYDFDAAEQARVTRRRLLLEREKTGQETDANIAKDDPSVSSVFSVVSNDDDGGGPPLEFLTSPCVRRRPCPVVLERATGESKSTVTAAAVSHALKDNFAMVFSNILDEERYAREMRRVAASAEGPVAGAIAAVPLPSVLTDNLTTTDILTSLNIQAKFCGFIRKAAMSVWVATSEDVMRSEKTRAPRLWDWWKGLDLSCNCVNGVRPLKTLASGAAAPDAAPATLSLSPSAPEFFPSAGDAMAEASKPPSPSPCKQEPARAAPLKPDSKASLTHALAGLRITRDSGKALDNMADASPPAAAAAATDAADSSWLLATVMQQFTDLVQSEFPDVLWKLDVYTQVRKVATTGRRESGPPAYFGHQTQEQLTTGLYSEFPGLWPTPYTVSAATLSLAESGAGVMAAQESLGCGNTLGLPGMYPPAAGHFGGAHTPPPFHLFGGIDSGDYLPPLPVLTANEGIGGMPSLPPMPQLPFWAPNAVPSGAKPPDRSHARFRFCARLTLSEDWNDAKELVFRKASHTSPTQALSAVLVKVLDLLRQVAEVRQQQQQQQQ